MNKLSGLLVVALIAVIGATTSNAGSDWLIFFDKEISIRSNYFNSPLLYYHHSFLNIEKCPTRCTSCLAGTAQDPYVQICTRICSFSNWCGDPHSHGGKHSTDCTGCAGTFYMLLIQNV